ncbi:S41 family peptidase [Sulfurovum sp. bin170]|uniref:S41 family peptidase n=1 Tax=Sulfurovum sp. bin170 TaxID=2695268 RepID=UPI0013E0D628|nr:S41 family peptidase [Sulfurovum sp. bin170]NEW60185.1 S41 family peptidase [Sulfurovum sp. bin170]
MIKKNKKALLFGFLSTVTASVLLVSNAQADDIYDTTQKNDTSKLEAYLKFTKIVSIVEEQYVDELNTSDIIDKALKGMLVNLDAHSSFMNAKESKDLQVQTNGEFGGLGISVGMKDGALTVIAPIEGTPADKAGMKSKDIILKIDDQATIGMTIDKAVSLMRGKPGTPIKLTVIRKGESRPLTIDIIRDIIEIQSVYAKTIGDDILYLRITSFDQKVVSSMTKSISEHPEAKGFVIDLRNNPGGLLNQAIGVVDMFIDHGVIVSQKGKVASENLIYNARPSNSDIKTPIVILVNDGSASASEIVSGALQDHKRAIVIGKKTFGKGSVQIVMPVGNSESLRLTIARYYLPSGRTIQAVGVTPDIEVDYGEIKRADEGISIKERDLQLHLESELEKVDGLEVEKEEEEEDKTIITEEQIYKDAQLKSAIDILKALMINK